MEQLQAQLADLEAQKAKLFEDGEADQVQISRMNERIKSVQAQISQLTAQQAEIEEKVHAEGVPFAISGVDFTSLDPELIELIDVIVKADRRKTFTEQAKLDAQREEDFAAYKSQAETRIATLEKDYNELEEEYLQASNEYKDQVAETIRVIAERDEARKNRDNAASQLDEANREIARLNSEVADYQKAKVFGERGSQKIVEINPDEAASINAALEKFKSKTKSALDLALEGNRFRGKVVVQDGKFEEVTSQPAGGSETPQGTFQDAAAADTGIGGISASESTITPPPFPGQGEVQNVDAAVGGESADAEVETITRAEFEELKARVANLEQVKVGVAA